MRRFITVLLIFLISVCIGVWIAEDPGLAYFSYKQWSVEMPLWFAALSLFVLLLLGYLLVRLSDSIDFSLYRWKAWLHWRRKYKAFNKTNRGLLELVEENWSNAESNLLDGIPQSDAPLINYLGAAKAAHQRGAYEKRDAYLRKAHDIAPNAEVVIGLVQARLLFEQGQLEQALAILGHLRSIVPRHKAVLKLLERVYVKLGEWDELLLLLPTLRKAKVINSHDEFNFEINIHNELLKNAIKNEGEVGIRTVWNAIPKRIRFEPELIQTYAKQMRKYPGAASELEPILIKAIKQDWQPDLVKLYGSIDIATPAKQLAQAETWLKQHPTDPVLLKALGRISQRCQLWGKARTYYENSLKLAPSTETYIEYGKLLEDLGDETGAAKVYYDGLKLCYTPGL